MECQEKKKFTPRIFIHLLAMILHLMKHKLRLKTLDQVIVSFNHSRKPKTLRNALVWKSIHVLG